MFSSNQYVFSSHYQKQREQEALQHRLLNQARMASKQEAAKSRSGVLQAASRLFALFL